MYTKILLIDDDQDDHDIFNAALSRISSEISCHSVYDGVEAIDYLVTTDELPDAIFADINMPKVGGAEFLYLAKQIDKIKHIPIYIYSTGTTLELAKQTISGATAYINKHDTISELVGELKDIFK